MKFIVLLFLVSFSAIALPVGATLVDAKSKAELGIVCLDQECRFAKFALNEKVINESFELDLSDMHDLYYHFRVLTTTASTSRAPFPYAWYMVNMMQVTKKLRKIFPMMYKAKFKSKKVKIGHKNFLEVIKAIKQY